MTFSPVDPGSPFRPTQNHAADVMRLSLRATELLEEIWKGDLDVGKISMALMVGQLEERPMDHSAIAAYSGVPRATVVRKLKTLEEEGAIVYTRDGRRKVPTFTREQSGLILENVEKSWDWFKRGLIAMSNMDSL